MKILAVVHAFPPEGVGGTERYARGVLAELVRRGHEVRVLSGTMQWRPKVEISTAVDEGIVVDRVHRSDLYFDHWDKVFNPHVSRLYERELDSFRPDLVHVHHWVRLSSELVRRAAQRAIPVVLHLHDLFVTCPRVFRIHREGHSCHEEMGEKACLKCVPRWKFQGDDEVRASLERYAHEARAEVVAARVRIAPSASHARSISGHLRLPLEAIDVLEHPRIGETWPCASSAQSPRGHLKLLFFAQLHPIKGLHRVLEAMRRLEPESGVELDVFGAFATKEYEHRVRELARGLEARFHGAYPPGEPARGAYDAIVLPSLAQESFSFWLTEAYDLGLPVLLSRNGALAERACGRARLVDPENVEEMAAALQELRDQPELRARMASASAPQAPSVREHVDSLEPLYAKAINAGAAQEVVPVARLEDVTFEWDRREWAFRELLRSEGWEDVISSMNRELEELRARERRDS